MALYRFYKRNQFIPIWVGIFLTFLMIPLWYRFPNMKAVGMGDFSVFYSAGFLIFWPMAWTICWWVLSGCTGIKSIWVNRTTRLWFFTCLIFAAWILLSWVWSYKRETYASVAVSAALPFILAIAFAVVMACIHFPIRWVGMALIIGLVVNSLLASAQVALQAPVGLAFLGEFRVDPASSGTVVVQADGIRWLRPYGLLPHPNMLGGFLVIALLAAFVWVITQRRRYWLLVAAIFLFGLWTLLLTFSRSAWLGLGLSVGLVLLLTFRTLWIDRAKLMRIGLILGVMILTLGLFIVLYKPFLMARAGVGGESIELRSTSDRNVYNQIAVDAIKESPILGVGIGNYPWYAVDYLAKTDFDLRGQPVHNIYLSAWSELGIIGLVLFIATAGLSFRIGLMNFARTRDTIVAVYYAAALGGVGAFLVIGLFDHYTWTIIQFQAVFWGVMAVAVQPPSSETV